MRKKIVLLMIVFIGILITSCMNLNNPPTIPNNPVPADKAKDVPVNTTLSWNATDPDKDILIYKVYFGENSNPLLVNKGQVDNKYNPGILKYNTTYYWKIVASDGKGGETSSPVWSFTTERNNPPVKPNTEVPKNGSMNIEITPYFSWRSSDPEDDPITYDFYFGESIETLELYKSKLEKSNYNMTDRVLNYNTKYYWKIVAKDSKGFKTEGDIWSFTTKPQNTSPELEITYPKNNSTNIELNPTITWSATDNENDEIKYKVYINGELKADNYTSKSYQLSNLNTNTTYTVKIIAIDEYNATTEKTISFTTTKAPTISLNKPDNNSIVIGKEITLSWTASDPDNDALTFDIYLDKNTNPTTKVKSDITETNTTVTVNDYDTYHWKVVAKDDKGAVTESNVRSFVSRNNTAPVINLIEPEKNAIIIGKNVTLKWEANDNEKDSITYNVYLDKNTNPITIINESYTSTTLSLTKEYGTYYWKIEAVDEYGYKATSEIRSFTLRDNTSPELEITYPKNNSTNIELNPTITWSATDNENDEIKYKVYINGELKADNYTSKSYQLSNLNTNTTYTVKIIAIDEYNATTEKTASFTTTKAPKVSLNKPDNNSIVIGKEITLSWTASDPDNDALTFDIYLDKNTNPTTKVKSDITETITTITVNDYGTYYWKIVAKDDKGAITESIVYSFTTKINQWQKTFGGSNHDKAYSIQQTTDGGFIVAGATLSNDGDISFNHGGFDYWIIKLDSNGNLI